MSKLDLSSILKLDITNKELEQLKQTLKKCQRLDYTNLPKHEKVDFDKFFVNKLRDIQIDLAKRQENHEFIDMQEIFIQIMELMQSHIEYVEKINKEADTFKNSSLRPKKEFKNYSKRNQKSF